jgi:hypothetical protein
MAKTDFTYGDLFRVFEKQHTDIARKADDYRPYEGNNTIWVWLKNHTSVIVRYDPETMLCHVRNPELGEDWGKWLDDGVKRIAAEEARPLYEPFHSCSCDSFACIHGENAEKC